MPINYFDQASRFAAKLDSPAFLSWLLGSPHSFEFRGWLDTRDLPFPGETDRVSDTVAHVENVAQHGVPWAVAVEFQTQPDPTMFGRMLGYLSGLWLTRKPDAERGSRFHLGAAVVNLTGSGSASREMSWPVVGLHTQLTIVERNFESESADDLLTGIEAGQWSRCLLPWVPLMSGAENPDTIDRWVALGSLESDRQRRAQFGTIALLFARRVGRGTIWEEKLKEWNVEESTYVNEWIAVGEKRGEKLKAQATILRLGAQRLGTAPATIEAAVRAIQDNARLERILDRLFNATSWDDLIATA